MRVLIAPDKFKGAASADEVAAAVARGFEAGDPGCTVVTIPVADGGEGTDEVLAVSLQATWRFLSVPNPYGRTIRTKYAWVEQPEGPLAIMTMARSAGTDAVSSEDPTDLGRATTRGVGEMIRHAGDAGATTVIVGLGGSMTNDGGMGLADALGYRFLAANGSQLPAEPRALAYLHRIEPPPSLDIPPVVGAVDVDSPLLGPHGATHGYARQKGAAPQDLDTWERGLARLADVASHCFGRDPRDDPGAGAAGGLGFGLRLFAGAELMPGFELVASLIDFERHLQEASLVVTAEGRIDRQSLRGKAPLGVAALARRARKPIIAFAGWIEDPSEFEPHFDALFPIVPRPLSRREAMAHTLEFLETAARQVSRLLAVARTIDPPVQGNSGNAP